MTIKNAEVYLSLTRDAMVSYCLLKLKSLFSFASYSNFVAKMSISFFDHFSWREVLNFSTWVVLEEKDLFCFNSLQFISKKHRDDTDQWFLVVLCKVQYKVLLNFWFISVIYNFFCSISLTIQFWDSMLMASDFLIQIFQPIQVTQELI